MATATVELSGGGGIATTRGRAIIVSTGAGIATSPVSWGGSEPRRPKVDWLPPPNVPWCDPKTGLPTPIYYRFMSELAERRMGGINGSSIPAVATTVTQTQALVASTAQFADAAVAYARGIGDATTAVTEVVQNNALPGSESVPVIPDPPIRTNPDEYIP